MNLYADGHPAREHALRASHDTLQQLLASAPACRFSFLSGEVVFDQRVLREFREWEWADRLAGIGIERLEFVPPIDLPEFQRFAVLVHQRLTGEAATSVLDSAQGETGIRYGRVSIAGRQLDALIEPSSVTGLSLTLDEELAGIRWIHDQVVRTNELPVVETETIVRSLALAMHQEGQVVLPLLELKRYDQYTMTHSSNVAVLSMGLAEYLGFSPREVRSLGVAAVLHDIGKVKVPTELLLKPGKYTPEERKVIETHPVEGARILLTRHRNMELPAIVAYEHHINLDGTGYPQYLYPRQAHYASKLVHVCDIYDALCAKRPYRDPFPADQALRMVEEGSGRHLEPDLVTAFATMIQQAESRHLIAPD